MPSLMIMPMRMGVRLGVGTAASPGWPAALAAVSGAGLTMACGTGACAAAEAALAWGLVPSSVSEVRVHMPGGEARVHIDASTKRAILTGPAQFVASIMVSV